MAIKNQEPSQIPEPGYTVTYEQLNTLIAFLRLWTQLGMWTRSLMISIKGDIGNRDAIINQLYSIATEMYNTFRIFYGPFISQQMLNLLSKFITSEWNLFDVLKSGEREKVDESTVRLYQTADELATYLSRLNVYWDEDQWKSLLYQYIRLVIDEMIALLSEDYVREIEIYKRIDEITDLLGNYMARGVISRSAGGFSESLMQ